MEDGKPKGTPFSISFPRESTTDGKHAVGRTDHIGTLTLLPGLDAFEASYEIKLRYKRRSGTKQASSIRRSQAGGSGKRRGLRMCRGIIKK